MGQKINVTQRTLRDIRDTNSYTVRKLADGNCWMTENLKLIGPASGSRRLYPSDTNITASYWDLPAVNTTFPSSCVDTAYNMSSGNDSYGAYYNWYAATAGTGTCDMVADNATSSICPKGWKLPTGGENGEFKAFDDIYQFSENLNFQEIPASYVFSGWRWQTTTDNQGVYGNYHSSTAFESATFHNLYFWANSFKPALGPAFKHLGVTMRCMAQ